MTTSKRVTGIFSAFVLLFMQVLMVPAAQAAMIGNDTVIQQQDRAQVSQRLDRLTDAELQQLAQKSEELPAGQGVLGVVLAIILVLVILDLLGATDVFPVIDPVN